MKEVQLYDRGIAIKVNSAPSDRSIRGKGARYKGGDDVTRTQCDQLPVRRDTVAETCRILLRCNYTVKETHDRN